MLNWIAIWVGELLLRPRRPVPGRAARSTRSRTRSSENGAPAGVLGRPAAAGPPHRLLHRDRRARRLLGRSSTARRSASRCARSASTPRRRATAASASRRNYFLAMAISGAFAGLAGAIDILGWQFQLATPDIHASNDRLPRHRGRAARAKHARSASSSRRSCSARLTVGTSTRQLDPTVFDPQLAGEPDADHPGPRRPVRRRRRARPLRLAVAQARAAAHPERDARRR